MIYVASPYTHPDEDVRDYRYVQVAAFCAEQAREGFIVYSPIVHWHTIATAAGLRTDWDFWSVHNFDMLARADHLWIYCIPGWEDSRGVNAERDYWKLTLKRNNLRLISPLEE